MKRRSSRSIKKSLPGVVLAGFVVLMGILGAALLLPRTFPRLNQALLREKALYSSSFRRLPRFIHGSRGASRPTGKTTP